MKIIGATWTVYGKESTFFVERGVFAVDLRLTVQFEEGETEAQRRLNVVTAAAVDAAKAAVRDL